MKEITVVEIIQAAKGKERILKNALAELVPICRASDGCLQYDLLESKHKEGEFLILMRWKDHKNLEKHGASPHIQAFINKYDRTVYSEATQTEWKNF